MNPDYHRSRISLTLTDSEHDEIVRVANLLGIKPTKAIYEAWLIAMPVLIEQHEKRRSQLRFAEMVSKQTDVFEPKKKNSR